MDTRDTTVVIFGALPSQVEPEGGSKWKDFLLHSLVYFADNFGIDEKTGEAQSYEMVHFGHKVDQQIFNVGRAFPAFL